MGHYASELGLSRPEISYVTRKEGDKIKAELRGMNLGDFTVADLPPLIQVMGDDRAVRLELANYLKGRIKEIKVGKRAQMPAQGIVVELPGLKG